jgi:hypothetical protein
LWQEEATTQAPTLREIRSDESNRVVVLDLILEVPAKYVSPLEQETRVLGFDWGVRSLITVSILEKPEGNAPYRQVSRPMFLDTGGIDGRQAKLRREIDRLKTCWRTYERRNRSPGLESVDPAGIALRLSAHLWRKFDHAQNRRAWTRCPGSFSELAQQYDRARRIMACAQVQVSFAWYPNTPSRTAWNKSYMPPLPPACQNVCLAVTNRPQKVHQVGGLALL